MCSENLKNEIMELLNDKEEYRELLFPRGFLLTDNSNVDPSQYPFYGNWRVNEIGDYKFFIHPKQKIYISKKQDITMALVGHAYNPVSDLEPFEHNLLDKALELYSSNCELFTKYFNEWTGIFGLFIFSKNGVHIYGDPAGMYTLFYGEISNKFYCSSHTKLIGDICDLDFSPYVERLISYKFYHLFGKALPGDITPYDQVKRVIPNHSVTYNNGAFNINRFFPAESDKLFNLSLEEIVRRSGDILSNSMKIIHQKWKRPAISLTGGCDSKTTLACTNGEYDKYRYYSYSSSDEELVDADAAKKNM